MSGLLEWTEKISRKEKYKFQALYHHHQSGLSQIFTSQFSGILFNLVVMVTTLVMLFIQNPYVSLVPVACIPLEENAQKLVREYLAEF